MTLQRLGHIIHFTSYDTATTKAHHSPH